MTFQFILIVPIAILGTSIYIISRNNKIITYKNTIRIGTILFIIGCICGTISLTLFAEAEKIGFTNRDNFMQTNIQEFFKYKDKNFK